MGGKRTPAEDGSREGGENDSYRDGYTRISGFLAHMDGSIIASYSNISEECICTRNRPTNAP